MGKNGVLAKKFLLKIGNNKYIEIELLNQIIIGNVYSRLNIELQDNVVDKYLSLKGYTRLASIYKEGEFLSVRLAKEYIKPYIQDIKKSDYKSYSLWDSFNKRDIWIRNGEKKVWEWTIED